MSEINFVTRENGMSELISKSYNEEFLELEEILNNHYPYILKSINNENYHIELGISDFFEEILYEDKVVGFVIFDIVNEVNIRIIDCYILPEFRGKRLFFNEIEKLIFLGSKISFLQPTRDLVELLLDFAYAKKVTDNIVVSGFEFDFEEFDLKSNTKNFVFNNSNRSSNFYDLNICSTIFADNDEIFYHNSLKNDVLKYGNRKQLTDDYFNQIKELFAKHHDEYYQLVFDLKKELPQLTLGYDEIVGHSEELSPYMLGMVNEGFYTYEEALDIKNKIKEEYESGKLVTDEDVNRRLAEILNEDIENARDSDDIKEIFSIRDIMDLSDEDNHFLEFIPSEEYQVDEDLANAVSSLLFENDTKDLDEYSRNARIELINYFFSEDSIIDDDLFPAINFSNPQDREIYFQYLLEGNNEEQYKLDNTKHKSKYPVIYDLAMFDCLKLFNKNNNFLQSINKEGYFSIKEEDEIEDLLVKKGYIDGSVDYENWDEYADHFLTVSALKDFLRKNNLKVSGRKQELVDRVRENNLSLDEFDTFEYRKTDKGIQYIKDNEWMEFYNIFLQPFDFEDFSRYYNSHNGNIEDIAHDYLDELFELGKKNKDSNLLDVIVKVKKIINHYFEKLFTNSDIFE